MRKKIDAGVTSKILMRLSPAYPSNSAMYRNINWLLSCTYNRTRLGKEATVLFPIIRIRFSLRKLLENNNEREEL